MTILLATVIGCLTMFAEPTAPVIPEGYRAYAIKIDAAQNGGFITPGRRFDVIHVVKVDGKNKASVIVSDVLLLAVDSKRRGDMTTDAAVLLAVNVDDAVKLAKAEKDGTLRLALRAPDAKREEPKPDGHRQFAFSLTHNKLSEFEPGQWVDVIQLVKEEGKVKETVLLKDVLVLKVDRFDRPGGGLPHLPRKEIPSISLAVKPSDALKLAAAGAKGELKFVVRPPEAKR